MSLYFNDNDAWLGQWCKNLWPDAVIDSRSIAEVRPEDLTGFTRVHHFAGIGGWEYALELAGWPQEVPVWTGSCPCQPFSTAGKRQGVADDRHLWPEFRRLIAECRPPVVFGEQVASKDGRLWLAGVRADLEALGYAVGAADLCAAGVGAPHIRQRLYWVAYTEHSGSEPWRAPDQSREGAGAQDTGAPVEPGRRSYTCTTCGHLVGSHLPRYGRLACIERGCFCPNFGGLGHTDSPGPQGRSLDSGEHTDQQPARSAGITGGMAISQGIQHDGSGTARSGRAEPANSSWDGYELVHCTDRRTRRIEPGSFPLAYGVPARVGRIRAYGNAIVPPLAAEFVTAFMEAVGMTNAPAQ